MTKAKSDASDTTRELPELPSWLEVLVEQEHDESMTCLEKVSEVAAEMYALLHRVRQGSADSACAMAERFEKGDSPGGSSMVDAFRWYEYAANKGSAKAAYRLALLQAWQNPREPLIGLDMTLLALQNIADDSKSFRWRSAEGWNLAANIVLHALEKGMIRDGNTALSKLTQMDGFQKHPDFDKIANAIRKLSFVSFDPNLSLVVVASKIHEDGDFRAGVYRQLEKPLPLVPVQQDVAGVQTTLDSEFPWFSNINALVCRQMFAAQYSTTPAFKLRPLLLAGAPGVGKTTWVKRLAELCEVPFRGVMAAGSADAMYLRGTPRGWASSRPGATLQAMVTEGVANPMFLIDELEKTSSDNRNGRLWDVLLQLLEPSSSKTYLDECLQLPCDLSWVTWIATANEIRSIPTPLLERFTIVVADSPSKDHFNAIVHGAVMSYAKTMGIDQRMLPSLSVDDMDVLKLCKSPREINRTVVLMMERRLVKERQQYLN